MLVGALLVRVQGHLAGQVRQRLIPLENVLARTGFQYPGGGGVQMNGPFRRVTALSQY